MERSTILRWIIIAVAIWLAWTYLPKLWGGGAEGGTSAVQPLGKESTCAAGAPCAPEQRAEETTCDVQGVRFKAQFSSRGASLKHYWLEGDRYRYNKDDLDKRHAVSEASPEAAVILPEVGHAIDLVTSPAVEQRRPLRFDWRGAGAEGDDAQVQYDAFDWQLVEKSDKHCVFTYKDDRVELRRKMRVTERPFEVEVEASIKNLSDVKRKHALSVELVSWLYEKEVESTLGRRSPFMTTTMCGYDDDTKNMDPGDFEPKDFSDSGFEGGWHVNRGAINFSAVSNFYFAQAITPEEPAADACRLQIEELWDQAKYPDKSKDPARGAMYRARISYPVRELDKDATATYKVIAFLGPKERDVLASAAGGSHHLSELVDLGYFSIIAKGLLYFLVWLHGLVGNWGVAIILMTIGVRTILAPLTWKSIKSGLAMRRLRPEIDAINKKYKDDAQGKNVATMELWKTHKVSPLGGCLPAVFQMPVWWALFQSLQTAVELYHTPFLWFGDLSAPDPYYIVPFILGGTMILQQRLMPMQMDPMQQKMMTYVMPLVFTVMMLFLPSGLAIYMLTNSVIGILQQLAIEKYWSGKGPGSGITVTEKPSNASGGKK